MSRLQDYRVQEYKLTFPPSTKCNVLRESLSEGSQRVIYSTYVTRVFKTRVRLMNFVTHNMDI
jgi:hypothetical protein